MANRFVKVGGSNLLDGTTTGNAWETAIYGFTNMGASNTLKFLTGTYDVSRSSLQTPIPNGSSGSPTIITDNGDGAVTFNWPGSGNVGIIYLRDVNKGYISFIGTATNQLIFDAEGQAGCFSTLYLGDPACHHINFTNCWIKGSDFSGVTGGASSDITYDGCHISGNGSRMQGTTPIDHGIYASGPNMIIKNSKFYDNYGWGLHCYDLNYSGREFYNNWFYNNGYGDGNGHGAGLIMSNGSGTIYNNICFENAGAGIELWRTTNATVYHNTCHQNGGYGIDVGRSDPPGATSGTLIKNNIVIDNTSGTVRMLSSCSSTTVSWNIMDGAISNGGISTSQSNNTTNAVAAAEFTNSSDATLASRDYRLRQVQLTNSSGNWTVAVASNVVTVDTISDHGFTAGMRAIFDADWTVNSFLASTSAIIASVPSSTTFTMVIVQGNQGATTETDTAAGIISQSTAIGGTTFNEVPSATISQDITGAVRPQGPFIDQGPYEYTAGGGETGGSTVWSASGQFPGSSWVDSGYSGYSVRVLMKAANISEDATAIRVVLKGRDSGSWTATKVSIVERDGSGIDAVGTITNITFGSTWAAGVTVAQGGQAISDDISFALDNTKDHFLTYYASGSVGAYWTGSGDASAWLVSGDIAGTADWEGQTVFVALSLVYGILLMEEADAPEPSGDAPIIGHTSPYTAVPGVYLSVPLGLSDGDSDGVTVGLVGENMTIRVTPTANVAVTVP